MPAQSSTPSAGAANIHGPSVTTPSAERPAGALDEERDGLRLTAAPQSTVFGLTHAVSIQRASDFVFDGTGSLGSILAPPDGRSLDLQRRPLRDDDGEPGAQRRANRSSS